MGRHKKHHEQRKMRFDIQKNLRPPSEKSEMTKQNSKWAGSSIGFELSGLER